jgi:uncharacterized protein with HEPN domain
MSAKRDDKVYLRHMLEAATTAMAYVDNLSLLAFTADRMRVDATVRQLAILGEAASKVSDEFRVDHPDIPWRSAVATRNVLIHDYASVLPDVLWTTVQKDLPDLVAALKRLEGPALNV